MLVESCKHQDSNNSPKGDVRNGDIKNIQEQRNTPTNKIECSALNKLEELGFLKIYVNESGKKIPYIDIGDTKKAYLVSFNEKGTLIKSGNFPGRFSIDNIKSIKLNINDKGGNLYDLTFENGATSTIMIENIPEKDFIDSLKKMTSKNPNEAEKILLSKDGFDSLYRGLQIPGLREDIKDIIVNMYEKKGWIGIDKSKVYISIQAGTLNIKQTNNQPIIVNGIELLPLKYSEQKIPTPNEVKVKQISTPNSTKIETKTETPIQKSLNKILNSNNIEKDLFFNYENFKNISSGWKDLPKDDKDKFISKIIKEFEKRGYRGIKVENIEISFQANNMFVSDKSNRRFPIQTSIGFKNQVMYANGQLLPIKFEYGKNIPYAGK